MFRVTRNIFLQKICRSIYHSTPSGKRLFVLYFYVISKIHFQNRPRAQEKLKERKIYRRNKKWKSFDSLLRRNERPSENNDNDFFSLFTEKYWETTKTNGELKWKFFRGAFLLLLHFDLKTRNEDRKKNVAHKEQEDWVELLKLVWIKREKRIY